ncbi:hypothetical protein IWW37_002322 [Coemansia sp. RSA 2050]|nr:hypothetical protein IWW37_002322 [Coemansia sp. RSA 2050]KAJ2734484.1 hypothetical protein IW152_002262 [Coemansia sp. BCRC 34962]
MNEHVQGIKLRFELPFKLPAPVSFPFESIGDFRPISRIPKYDFSLEKKIMKEISKQKQQDQFDMLRQAQQQLSMVDLIASRKNRHKGKEPERTFQAAAAGSAVTSPLTKPRSDSGVTRPQSAAASGVYAGTEAGKRKQAEPSTPLTPQPKPQKPVQEPSGLLAQSGASMSPADTTAAVQGSQVERPHSAEPALTTSQPTTAIRPIQPATSQQFAAGMTAATYRPTYQPVGNSMSASMASMAGTPPNFHQSATIRPQGNMQQSQPSLQAGMYRPIASVTPSMYPSPNFSTGYPAQSSVRQQASLNAIAPSSGFGPMLSPGMNNMAPRPMQQQQQLQPQFQTHMQIPPPQQQPQPQLQYSQPSLPMAAPRPIDVPRTEPKPSWMQETPSRPALPPKPDEWKSGASTQPSLPATEPAQSSSASTSGPLPLPPRRIVKQPDPAAPAIPPKPFTSFSEFDYARDEPSGSSTLEQSSGHVEQVSTLVSMGFSQPQALQALEMYDYDVNKASNYLIDKAVFSGN